MCSHQCSVHGAPLYSVHQSLDELEFERGIWGSAIDGNIEKLTKLLNNIDPSTPDLSGYTALHYAARNGKEEVCKLLLEKGANPNAQTHGGATPLHRAAFIGHEKIVSLLLGYKADLSLQDSDGKTVLHKAAEGQHFSVAKILITSKPELKFIKDKRGNTAVTYIKENNSCLKELLS